MKNTTLIVFLVFFLSTQAQKVDKEKRTFSNQGDQENYWAEKLFSEKYKKQSFKRFDGEISIVNENMIRYDDEVLIIYNIPKQLKAVFEKGIFYPEIITSPVKKGIERKQDLESMLISNDSLRISDFEELSFLSKSVKVKRFRFWLFSKGRANPTACFMELTNNNATEKTTIENFINNAKLTFYKSGWLIL